MRNVWFGEPEEGHVVFSKIFLSPEKEAELRTSRDDDDLPENPVSYSVDSGVATVGVYGGTYTSSSFFTRLFGVPTYEDIRDRLVEALEDANVTKIILSVDSPGGAAAGVKQLSSFITDVSKVKPVTTFVEGRAYSAALWYGTAAGKMVLSDGARTGSLGALLVHTSIQQMRQTAGISDTVFRTSPDKAPGHPLEKLSDSHEAIIKEELQELHDEFVNGVAANLSMDPEDVQANIATGRTFNTLKSIELGIGSRVQSYATLLNSLAGTSLSEENSMKGKKQLSASVAAALASGVDPASLGVTEGDLEQATQTAETTDSTVTTGPAETAEENNGTAVTGQVLEAATSDNSAFSAVFAQLNESNSKIATLTAELAVANKSLAVLNAASNETATLMQSYRAALSEVTRRFSVATGVTVPDLSSVSDQVLLDYFNTTNTALTSKFKIGSTSARTGEVAEAPKIKMAQPRATTASKFPR